jgi:hypothetical protein
MPKTWSRAAFSAIDDVFPALSEYAAIRAKSAQDCCVDFLEGALTKAGLLSAKR